MTDIAVSDGRGGEETISGTKGPRYVYYRLYTKDGAIESINPLYYDYHFISRVLSKSVTPPHTAASLKKHLCSCEGFKATEKCDLHLSLSEKIPVEDSTRIPLRGGDGPGMSESEPMALVIDVSIAEKRLSGKSARAQIAVPKWQGKQRHIHYRVYNESGETTSARSFNETDVSLGRINVLRVPLPHTGASLKAYLAKVEGVINQHTQLFEDEGGDTTLEDGDSIALLSGACPGILEDAPLAFVHREIIAPEPKFPKQLKALVTRDWGNIDSAWHSTTAGEIFKTNGVPKMRRHTEATWKYHCYEAVNYSGKLAFLLQQDTEFC